MSSHKLARRTRFTTLLSELKERKVLRVAIAYIVVAWIVMQVGEVTFTALKLPPWSQSLLVFFPLPGFLIAYSICMEQQFSSWPVLISRSNGYG